MRPSFKMVEWCVANPIAGFQLQLMSTVSPLVALMGCIILTQLQRSHIGGTNKHLEQF